MDVSSREVPKDVLPFAVNGPLTRRLVKLPLEAVTSCRFPVVIIVPSASGRCIVRFLDGATIEKDVFTSPAAALPTNSSAFERNTCPPYPGNALVDVSNASAVDAVWRQKR